MRTYHLSSPEYHVLLFLVELPITLIWFAAFYAFHRLQRYTASIVNTKEEEVFQKLTSGFQWLAWGLVVPTIISLITESIAAKHPGFESTSIISANYLNVIFSVVAFSYIADSAHKLFTQANIKTPDVAFRTLLFFFVTLGTLYCFFTFRHLDLQHLSSNNNPYYIPVWLLIFTIIVPYLYTWLLGILSAYQFALFSKQVKGIIYRRALQFVSGGVAIVILDSIGIQYLHTVIPRSGHLALNIILLASYFIYFCIVLGFILISLGVNKLKKIEDI
jgi:hypothetical protein